MRNLIQIIEAEDKTLSGETGHWVNIRGRPIFIGEPSQASKRLSTLDPSGMDRGKQTIQINVKVDGKTVKTVTKAVYSDKWNKATARYKFAIANDIEKNRDKIEGALEKEVLSNKAGASLACCALIIAKTGMRVGNPGNATVNDDTGESEDTYGATTLERRHVKVEGDTTTFAFKGKAGVDQNIVVKDPTIAKGISNILATPGEDNAPLFMKMVDKKPARIRREDVTARFKRFNDHYKPKDFRTAQAMRHAVDAAHAIMERQHDIPKAAAKAKRYAKDVVKEIGEAVSKPLGNTPSVAISNYTNPLLVEHVLKQIGFKQDILESMSEPKLVFVEGLEDPVARIASGAGEPMDTPLLVALYGEDVVHAWFSELSLSLNGSKEQTDLDLAAASVTEAVGDDFVQDITFGVLSKVLEFRPSSRALVMYEKSISIHKERDLIGAAIQINGEYGWKAVTHKGDLSKSVVDYVAVSPHKADLGMYWLDKYLYDAIKGEIKADVMNTESDRVLVQLSSKR